MANTRIHREIQKLTNAPADSIHYFPSDDIHTWAVSMEVADNKTIRLELNLPVSYPYKPPKVKVISRFRNQYIYDNGSLCLDILGPTWSPSMTVESVMVSILSMLKEEPHEHQHSTHHGFRCCCNYSRPPRP